MAPTIPPIVPLHIFRFKVEVTNDSLSGGPQGNPHRAGLRGMHGIGSHHGAEKH